jgi:NADPH:quinone reductase-like Zn-dependent oxidoreductase
MKAIVYTKYGSADVLHLEEVAKPVPTSNQVLVKVVAAALTVGDLIFVKGEPFLARLGSGLFGPKHQIPGKEMAGRVEAVGANVTQFKPGDEIFGNLYVAGLGAFAEYVCVPETAIALKPANTSFEEAAAVAESAVVALQGLRDYGKIQPGQNVLINGASGGVGTFAVQIAKAFGAVVTAVCSTRNLAMATAIGADHVIDYTQEDFTQNGQRYDLILAANGFHPLADYRRALCPNGIYIMTGGSMEQMTQAMIQGPWISMTGNQKMGNMNLKPNKNDLVFMKGLLETGKIKPVIDRRYPLSEVPAAFRYLDEGHAQGKVVITVAQSN